MTANEKSAAPRSRLDPFSDDFLRDPYPRYAELRDRGPVIDLERYGVWALPRYAEVFATLRDWDTFVSGRGVGLLDFAKDEPWREPSLLLEADPPLHTRTRRVLNHVLSLKVLRQLRASLAEEAELQVAALAARGRFDAVRDLGEGFVLKVFPDAMGLPTEGRENLLPYGDMAFNAFGPRNRLVEAATRRAEKALGWVATMCRRESLAPTGFGQDIYAAADAGELSQQEAPLVVRSLLTAGLDTTVNGIAVTLLALSQNPEQYRLLCAHPELARSAFDEALRLHSPVQTFFRTCARVTEISGIALPEGAKILMFLGSANRDPRSWDEPDTYRIERRTSGHVAFGAGIHACVGQMIARLEVEVVLDALIRHAREIAPAGPPIYRLNNTMRALDSVPVQVTSR